ncbi:MAG: glycosyltransferase family 2 protein [Weeksellaceae bacterium]
MHSNNDVSVIIHTYKGEATQHVLEAIASAHKLTSNIIVIDMESTPAVREQIKKNAVKIVSFPFSHYVEPARAFGIQQANTDWVFILDADERITSELAAEIKERIQSTKYSYYKVPRKNIFGKVKWLKSGGWWPDHQMRLIHKPDFKSWPKQIHATPVINGEMGYLDSPLLHYFHGDLQGMVQKTTLFENIESDLLYKANRPVKTSTFFRKFVGELYRRLLKNRGFMDGPIGVIESIYQAYSKTITYLYLYEKKHSSNL